VKKILGKLTYANVMATVAVFIALGGASYAAIKPPKNSVGAKQLKRGAVTPAKLSPASKKALTGPGGPSGATGPQGPKGDQGGPGTPGNSGVAAAGLWAQITETGTLQEGSGVKKVERTSTGRYRVEFERDVSDCNPLGAMTVSPGEIVVENAFAGPDEVLVQTFSSTGTAADRELSVAVIC
jgi:hypothetical protein